MWSYTAREERKIIETYFFNSVRLATEIRAEKRTGALKLNF